MRNRAVCLNRSDRSSRCNSCSRQYDYCRSSHKALEMWGYWFVRGYMDML